MLISFTATLKNLDDEPIQVDDKDLTLAAVCEQGLLTPLEEDKNLTGAAKVHRALLAHEIHRAAKDARVLDVISEDVVLLKDRVDKVYPAPWVVHQAWSLLEPVAKKAATGD